MSNNIFILVVMFVASLIALPAIGLICGNAASIPCDVVWEKMRLLCDKFLSRSNSVIYSINNRNDTFIDTAAVLGMKIFYLLVLCACIPILLALAIIAMLAFMCPMVAIIGFAWTYVQIAEPILVIATGIFCIVYFAILGGSLLRQ